MKILVGLGNIGLHFQGTRHNAGYLALDFFANSHGMAWQPKDKLKAMVAEGMLDQQKILLVKPTTYYNLSGEAVQAVLHFYKLGAQDVVVAHDELALPFGVVRSRLGGSDAGNNGIKSIVSHVGPNFARIRLGIANDLLAKQDAADFVLGHFSHDERQQLPAVQKSASDLLRAFIADNFAPTTLK